MSGSGGFAHNVTSFRERDVNAISSGFSEHRALEQVQDVGRRRDEPGLVLVSGAANVVPLFPEASKHMVKELQLTRGYVALVDDEDFDDLNRYRWQAEVHKQKIGNRIRVSRSSRRPDDYRRSFLIDLGRYLLGILHKRGVEVDHINGDTLNFQRFNLRVATRSQNGANRRKSTLSRSPYKGIYFHKGKQRWSAEAKVNGKRIRLGTFTTPEDAARAYDNCVREIHGEFARFNFPNDGERHV